MNTIRLYTRGKRVAQSYMDRLKEVSTPSISDSLERTPGAPGLLPVGNCLASLKGKPLVGRAFTVRTRAGDNLAVHKGLDLAEPGDVLVIDAGGFVQNAILGELMSSYAHIKKLAGIVVDGAIRDSAAISAGPIPVFARGVSHLGPYKSGPGELHGPVSIGGYVVNDGDVVVADADGVVFIAKDRIEEATAAAEAVIAKEKGQREAIREDRWDRSWVDAMASVVSVEPDEDFLS